MSYEGFTQYIGHCGHQWEVNAGVLTYGSKRDRERAATCSVCGSKAAFWADVDVTNGYQQAGDPSSFRAPVRKVGFTDTWHTDHYGNRYAVKHPTFQPKGSRWRTF